VAIGKQEYEILFDLISWHRNW